MLILNNLVKDYLIQDNKPVNALKNISLEFSDTGFVSILGPSGCGKTTLLNIIGGLDKYTSGDVIINGHSTKNYTDQDWDTYRNREIGIVFQSYNLIPHLTVKGNVELAMTLSGVSLKERSEKAIKALESVGLKEQINKKPNQLSGGQMQRVALARALVNEPNIILADEPTGALDSNTSIQVMDILKEISKNKLVIIVTHNEELALKYSDRIIRVSDGQVVSDSQMNLAEEKEKVEREIIEAKAQDESIKPALKKKLSLKEKIKAFFSKKDKHTSMSYTTALGISGRNLLTKKGKTIITAIAASFGIIGVGLVLALSNGFTNYVNRMEAETMSQFPMTIEKYGYNFVNSSDEELESYPDEDVIHVVEPVHSNVHTNNITEDFINYLNNINQEEDIAKIRYNYSIGMNVISRYETEPNNYIYSAINTSQQSYVQSLASSMLGSGSDWKELPASKEQILEQYDILKGEYPDENNNLSTDDNNIPDQDVFDLVLVVDSHNSLSTNTMISLGLNPQEKDYSFDDLLGLEFKYVPSEDYYGNPIPVSELSDDGESVPTSTPGFYFKDDVTINDIMNVLNQMQSEDFDATKLFELFDLPSTEVISAALQDPEVSAIISPLLSSDYIDTIKLLEIFNKLQNNQTITDEDLQTLFSPLADDQDKQVEFGTTLRDVIRSLRSTEAFAPYFNKQLYYYESPSEDQVRLSNLYSGTNGTKTRTLRISAILRQKDTTSLGLLSSGIYYPKTLTYQAFYDNSTSSIASEFKSHILLGPNQVDFSDVFAEAIGDISSGKGISEAALKIFSNFEIKVFNVINNANQFTNSSRISDYMDIRLELGSDFIIPDSIAADTNFLDPQLYTDFVTNITIYPTDYDSKQKVIDYLNAYNEGKAENDQIMYTDVGQTATDIVGQIVSVISAVLIAFASISLVVSSVMIAILIYSSVVERTKEIGVLRSIGARKKDVSRLFKAEAVIIGILSGLFGVVFTYLISLPISAILNMVFPDVALGQICFLNPLHAILLILISAILTYIASLIPSRIAARKDPVTCLRTE